MWLWDTGIAIQLQRPSCFVLAWPAANKVADGFECLSELQRVWVHAWNRCWQCAWSAVGELCCRQGEALQALQGKA